MNIPKEIQESRIAWAASDAKRDSGLQEPQGIEKFCDLDYAGDGITEHLLDVYRPVQNGENLPVLISIHGGGWFYGDKELYRFYCMHMAELGFVVVNCNYRLAPEHPYPAAIADVCQAIRWTLAHRKQYTSNPHWFLVGDSAGAQLVSQYCILAGNAAYRERLDFATYDQLPDGTALNCGIYDMSLENIHKNIYTQEAAPEQQKLFEQVLTYMNSSFPPSYLMASVNDGLRPRTTPMRQQLEACGIPFTFAEYGEGVPSDSHVFHLNLYSENGKACNQAEADFFHRLEQQETRHA